MYGLICLRGTGRLILLGMDKKIFIPITILIVFVIIAIATCSGSGKVVVDYVKVPPVKSNIDTMELKVYVENSGSMDAYMCSGSNLKDAVFDYVSDLRKYAHSCTLYYINSQIIPYKGNLISYIKDLDPIAFANAGGDRSNTDLRKIFSDVMQVHKFNTVSVFVSDCILDIPESATDFFGNCQVSIKNTFNEALAKNPNLGVEIIKLQSKFDGYWYCGKNSEKLSNVKRPYYIWVIGDKKYLSELNKKVPVNNIIGGIQGYCAYSNSMEIPFEIEKRKYVINHTGKISVQILADLNSSLQSEMLIRNISQYKTSTPTQSYIASVNKITAKGCPYSHVLNVEIDNPSTIKTETITFSYPYLPSWVSETNDSTGLNVKKNIHKTTGILSLIKGVADAYKSSTEFGSITFNLKNK